MSERSSSRLILGAGAFLGLISMPVLVRWMDRRREKGEGAVDRPSILDGKDKEGIRSLDGTALYVDYLGEKDPTVFLIHGYSENGQVFRYQKPYLAGKYRVVSLDLRGHGRSEVPESGNYHTERLAEDLKAVVDAFEPEKFVLVGHSMGGFTSFTFYERFGKDYEGRLKGLAIIDSTGVDITGASPRWRLFISLGKLLVDNTFSRAIAARMDKSSLTYFFLRWLAFGKRPPASEVEFLQQMSCSVPIAALRGAARGCDDYLFERHLPGVDIPVILLVGSEDSLMADDRRNQRTYSLLPDARLEVFEGAGHNALQERPEELNRALDGFLTEVFGGE
ncbi:MAG: alpha/beta hydrolase [Actinomycetota bacterium]|nr:alpha/beta hydrolase [Actinomycetota bacterium]